MENNLLSAKTLDSIMTGKIELGSSCPYMSAVLNFRTELTLVNLADSTRSQVLTRALQRNYHFASIISDGTYARAPHEFNVQ